MNTPSHKKDARRLSRRQVLKSVLAAGGAVALANLPSKWQTPQVEVGQLPAHAQGSPGELIISSLNISGRQGVCDPGTGEVGDLFRATFNYRDATGGAVVPGSSQVRATYEFSDGRTNTDSVSLEAINISGDGRNGQIVMPLCVGFGSATAVDVTLSITNNRGDRSNTEQGSIANP